MRLSYSSISTYETCPAKYRFQYEDRVETGKSPARAFGDSLHRALRRFHNRPVPVAPSIPELLEMLEDVWVADGYRDDSEERRYFQHARQVLIDYHRENAPAFRIPAALEFRFTLGVEGVEVTGTIDRMDRIPGGGYEIVDYKTNRRLPPRSVVDRDLQLSLYYLAANEIWGVRPERLTLYFLLPGQRMTTFRTPADTEELRRRIATVAERISAGKFEPRQNRLCEWCDFQSLCPVFRHRFERQAGDPARGMNEVVDEWIALKREDRERSRRLEELRTLINAYCDEHGYRRLFGTDGSVVERRTETVGAPDLGTVRSVLEPLGLSDRVTTVDAAKLSELIASASLPPAAEDALLLSRREAGIRHALDLKEPARTRR